MNPIILDCTLRDGGYYNNWDFENSIVAAYLAAVSSANIDYVELGLRNFPRQGFLGAYAYTTEQHLNSLELPAGPTYGVMVDAKTILESGLTVEEAVDTLFVPATDSKLGLVRIAAHFKEVENCGAIAKKLKSMGYIVGYNLMQAGGKPDAVISEKTATVASWNAVDVLYFADSLGNMNSAEVERIVGVIKKEWYGQLGIHTHNNMGKGLDNTLIAQAVGVSWLDTTVTGMGRGAGNTQTENLLAVFDKKESKYNAKPIYDLVIKHFEGMQKEYGWGSSLLYFLGAQNDVHPTYIQNLIADTHYGPEEVVGAIDYLSKLKGTESYNGDVLYAALNINSQAKSVSGSTGFLNRVNGQEVLIVNNAPSLIKYNEPIKQYITERKPVVIAVNMLDSLTEGYIDYFCISHNTKFLSESSKYSDINKPIILPKHRFSDEELKMLPLNRIDYGISVEKDVYSVGEKHCTLPFDLTIAYAISSAVNGGASKISLVGVDGYASTDPRQLEMIKLFESMDEILKEKQVVALTPTSYPILQGSIYEPVI